MTNLFSSFDPTVSIMSMSLSLNWLAASISVLFLPQTYWLVNSQIIKSFLKVMFYLKEELSAVFGATAMPGTIYIYISIFFFILFSNFMGLMPYIFTSTSHLSMTLCLSLPLWIGSMVWSIVFQYNSLLAHLVPTGTPSFLMPVMVVIETVSNVIRPATLTIRLPANMVAGHLLLTLLGSQGPALGFLMLMGLFVGLVLLLLLEVAVACIQSYVFTILSSLYLNELMGVGFNKKMV
uniref:ATP synthase subunit a n=1 Tax=Calanus hyperboreus TaxID=114069 RepID=K7QJZ2_CALHY|nr:ATP synthase F0 subunit 6 [Calanus hyperboreus]AFU88791.1 ATP synthase F0 subunit 6 [Calanus hyperboreus]